jgi:hypothetical protein
MRVGGTSGASSTCIVVNVGVLDGRGALDQILIERSGIPSSADVVARPRPTLRRSARYASTSRFTASGYRLPLPHTERADRGPDLGGPFLVCVSMPASLACARPGVTTGYGEDLRLNQRANVQFTIFQKALKARCPRAALHMTWG